MATSADPALRLQALREMRERIAGGVPPTEFLSLARQLVADSDNDCRWQALIVVGESVEAAPETVWDVIWRMEPGRANGTGTGALLLVASFAAGAV